MTCSAATGRIQRDRGMSLIPPPAKLTVVIATTVNPHTASVAARGERLCSCRMVNQVRSAVSAKKSACRPNRVSVPVAREIRPSSRSVTGARTGTVFPRRFSSAGRFALSSVRVLATPSVRRFSIAPRWLTVRSQLATTHERRHGSAHAASPACSAVDSRRARRLWRPCRTDHLVARARNLDQATGVHRPVRRARMSSSVAARRSGSSRTSSLTAPSVISFGSISRSAPTHSRAAIEWADVVSDSFQGHREVVGLSVNSSRVRDSEGKYWFAQSRIVRSDSAMIAPFQLARYVGMRAPFPFGLCSITVRRWRRRFSNVGYTKVLP